MLAIITHNGVSLIDPASLKDPPNSFPIASSLICSASACSPDNSQFYLANASSIKRYTPSECLLEEIYCGSDAVTCMVMNERDYMLFYAAANKVWSLDCADSPAKIVSSLEPHKGTITRISMSSDGNLLASVSASAVFVHNLSLSTHTQLKGLPDRKLVTCCLFHPHSKTRLLLGVGRDLVVYDSTRPSSPLKTVRVPGGGHITGLAASPFSKTLIAIVMSIGDVVLVDLEKDNGILKAVNVKASLTCCTFTAEGAAIYLGTESGELLILDLRSLEKDPKSFIIGDDGAPIKAINVQGKTKSHLTNTTNVRVKSNPTAAGKSSPQRPVPSTRTTSIGSVVVGPGTNSPQRVAVMSRTRGGTGFTSKKKLFSHARAPLSETKNLELDARQATLRSPTLSRYTKPTRPQRCKEFEEKCEAPAPSIRSSEGIEHLGLGLAPQSISGYLTAMRVRSGPVLSEDPKDESNRPRTPRRVISESVATASDGRKHRNTISVSAKGKIPSRAVSGTQGRHLATSENTDDRPVLSSPDLPRGPVTPVLPGKNAPKALLASMAGTSTGVLGLTSPDVAKRDQRESQKGEGKERVVEMKKIRFSHHPHAMDPSRVCDESEDEGGLGILADERNEERKQELSLQVSPRRPTALPAWFQSPHRPPAASLNMNSAAQDFLRSIVHDVMYDFQRETKAEMMGLHLDLVRMGRGWKQELREIMDEWNGEIQKLKAENKRLKEENERLRRGH